MAVGTCATAPPHRRRRSNAQPMLVNHIKGRMALATTANLTNSTELRTELELQGSIFHSTSDTEVISYIITKGANPEQVHRGGREKAMNRLEGAYSLVIMSPSKLIAARGPPRPSGPCAMARPRTGPISWPRRAAPGRRGRKFVRDIEPGEILVFQRGQEPRRIATHCGKCPRSLCVFEYIYFARPDSVIDGCNVHAARARAGAFLALEHPAQADVVIGVRTAASTPPWAMPSSPASPTPWALIKNRYIARTFIAPGQAVRQDKVKIKLNPIAQVVSGKRVVLIDDSIVRGTTSARIIRLLRDAGAKEIHMRVSAPPFVNPCYYGTDIDSRDHLIACHHTVEEIAEIIGVDSLGYLSLDNAYKLCNGNNCKGFCAACFGGDYPTAVPKAADKNRFEKKISEK